jgi:predicted esterase
MRDSVKHITEIIEDEIAMLGSAKKIFIGGFNQGGTIALGTYLSLPGWDKLGGVFMASSSHLMNLDWPNIDVWRKKHTPLMMYNGKADERLEETFVKYTFNELKE